MNQERTHTTDPESLDLIDAVRGHLPKLIAKHQTPGLNIALADKGRLVWEASYGFADVLRRVPMTPDSVYHSGSLAKTYTATAIMMLADRGLLRLTDPANRYLPFSIYNPLGRRDITIHDFMVHMSGLGADDGGSSATPGTSLVEDVAAEYAREWSPTYGGAVVRRWVHPVGETWVYSNLGIATLGVIVENANEDGLSFSQFIEQRIMRPLGMTHSCYPISQHPDFVPKTLWDQMTTGYSRMGTADIPALPVYIRESPAGGSLGRPADHIQLLLAMMFGGEFNGYRLFSERTASEILSPATKLGPLATALGNPIGEQGLIWRLHDHGRPWASFSHSGGHMFGWRTEGRAWPRPKTAVVVGVSQWRLPDDTMEVQEIVEFVGAWIRYRQPLPICDVTPAALSYVRGALLCGAYRIAIALYGDISPDTADSLIRGTRSRGNDWDPAAFKRGFEHIRSIQPTREAMQEFWTSELCEVDLNTVRRAYASLGGNPGASSLWSLLPVVKQ